MNSFQAALDPLSGPLRPRNRRRNPLWRFRRVFFVLALFGVVGVGAILYVFSKTELPEDQFEEIAETSYICTAEVAAAQLECGPDTATALFSTGGEDREVVTYEEIPEVVINAVVATEDQDFWTHRGFDEQGMLRAFYRYLRQDDITQGASTITQQYVKLAFNDREVELSRKAREIMRAIKLEQDLADQCADDPATASEDPTRCAKEEILTRYLNRAYFGRGASGVASAVRVYFGHDLDQVTVSEAAFLAGLLRNPARAEPERYPDEANRRRDVSVELMLGQEYITEAEAAEAVAAPLVAVPKQNREGLGEVAGSESGSQYFIEEVRQQLDDLFPNGEIYTKGYRVYTTLDHNLQAAAYQAAYVDKGEDEAALEARGKPELGPTYFNPLNDPNEPSAAIVSIDAQGRVVAMVGGQSFEASEYNLATSSGGAGRQPGSTFKPVAMAVAVEQGISPESLYPAVPGPVSLGEECADASGNPWTVSGGSSTKNRYRSLIEAMKVSSNVVFAELVVDIGPTQLRDGAYRLGVTSDLDVHNADGSTDTPCSLVLGSQGVPVIEMASVFSTFERAGVRLDPVLIDRIENADGEVICWHPVDGLCDTSPDRVGEQVMDAQVIRQVNYALTEVVSDGGSGTTAWYADDRPIAGKTGTSQNHRDAWFAGFTCDLTTVVWNGYSGGQEKPMIDFRHVNEDGTVGPLYEADGVTPIDNPNYDNVFGGTFPAWMWKYYMQIATADDPPCEGLEVSEDFTGTKMNPNLSSSTLPPCGVQLDQYGYPVGDNPDEWEYTAPAMPDGGDGGNGGGPEGLPVQDPEVEEEGGRGGGGGCTPLADYIRANFPDYAPPVEETTTTSTLNPFDTTTTTQNNGGGNGNGSTSLTRPGPGSSQLTTTTTFPTLPSNPFETTTTNPDGGDEDEE